jgi:hypothetical protein
VTIALVIIGGLLGIFAALSGVLQLANQAGPLKMKARIGLSDSQFKILALLKLAGAAGLLIGVWVPWIGALSAGCLALYFLGGTVAELRVKARGADLAPAIVFTVPAIATTVLELRRF